MDPLWPLSGGHSPAEDHVLVVEAAALPESQEELRVTVAATRAHSHTIAQSHGHTVKQSHGHTVTQSHGHTGTQSHSQWNTSLV
eukprot:8990714-Pyramimonas_sp.AAC.2